MSRRASTSFFLPLVVFPAMLALGAKFMHADHLEAGMDRHIHELCSQNTTSPRHPDFLKSYVRNYTHIPAIDASEPGLCVIVAFFHLLLDAPTPAPRQFLAYLLGTGLPCMLVPLVEAYRYPGKQHWLLRWPVFWLVMTQVATMAMTFPVYFMLLILSREEPIRGSGEGSKSTQGRNGDDAADFASTIKPEQAKALICGLIIGGVLPSAAMMLVNDAWVTWAWQFYPIFIAVFRDLYLHFQGSAPEREKATRSKEEKTAIIWTTYLVCFGIASFTHAHLVWPLVFGRSFSALQELVVPFVASSGLNMHPSQHGHNFLKWDYLLGSLAVLGGLLWSARGYRQVRDMLLWYAFAVPVFGFGGAVMGVLVWQDLLSI